VESVSAPILLHTRRCPSSSVAFSEDLCSSLERERAWGGRSVPPAVQL
jgi:hypothetical protein